METNHMSEIVRVRKIVGQLEGIEKMIISTNKNTLKAYGTIWDGDGSYFVSCFQQLERVFDDITVRIHTSGGSVFDGNLIYNVPGLKPYLQSKHGEHESLHTRSLLS